MTVKVVLAGCGNMGYAMLRGWLTSGQLEPAQTFIVEPNAQLRARAQELGSAVGAAASDIPSGEPPALVVLAVKPQVIREVTAAYASLGNGKTTFVSVAAGTKIATFEEILGDKTPVIRVMPNLPAAIGKGMMVVCSNGHVATDTSAFVQDLLATSGAVATVDDEGQMDAVTAVSGSGPGYVFHFIECLTSAAEQAGLPKDTAKLLAIQTVLGSASLAAESDEEAGTLRQQVTSPNGTTEAGLAVLMGNDRLKALMNETVNAARLRSIELGK